MNDFLIIPAEFSPTKFLIKPSSEKGAKELQRRFGEFCTSINVKKSQLPDYVKQLELAGFLIS